MKLAKPKLRWGRRETLVLRVFISSPADCAEERRRVEELLLNFSRSDEATALNIRLEPILWERFPPGQAEPGDFQIRINRLLQHYGASEYEIYFGMMKNRVGTPTPRHASGTVEEFEAAWTLHKGRRMPAEVLFYFLEYGAAPEEGVKSFRESLKQRGFLPGSVQAGPPELEQMAYHHVARIADEWRHWRNVARRSARRARPGAALFFGLLAVLAGWWFWRYDLGGARRVRDELAARGAFAATEAYAQQAPYMLTQRAAVRREINQRFAAETAKSEGLRRFEMFEQWSATPSREAELVEAVRTEMARGAAADLDQRIYKLDDGTPVYYVRRALQSGVWKPGSQDARRAIGLAAARAMLQSLATTGADPFEWHKGYLRPAEAEAVAAFAREAIRRKASATWTSRDARIGAAAMAADWDGLERMAAEAVRRNEPPLREAVLLVEHGPEDKVAAWVAGTMAGAAPPSIAAVFQAAARRKSVKIILSFVDLLGAGKLDLAGGIPDDIGRALSGLSKPETGKAASDRLMRALDGKLRPEALAPLIPVADVSGWNPQVRARAAARLVSLLRGKNDLPAESYLLLGQLGSGVGNQFLEDVTKEYLEERTSFGMAIKAALVDAWATRRDAGAMERARRLLAIAERERSGFTGNRTYTPDPWPVAAAYLRAAKAMGARFAGADREVVTHLAERRILDPPAEFTAPVVDLAFGEYLSGLRADEWLALLALPTGIVSDEVEGKWERRNYLIAAAISAGGKLPAEAMSELLLHMPFQSPLREQTAALLARAGDPAVPRFFQREVERDPKRNQGLANVLRSLGPQATPAAAPIGVEELRKGLAESGSEAARMLLRRAAASASLDWSVALGAPEVQRAMRNLLTKGDTAEWVFLCQEFPPAKNRSEALALLPLAQARTAFWTVDAPGRELDSPAFRVDGRIALNTLVESAARVPDREVWQALYAMQIAAGSPETIGGIPNPRAVYRGLLLWLAAPMAKSNASWREVEELLPLLDDNDPSLVRGVAAGLLHWAGE